MARFSRLQVLNAIIETGLVPVVVDIVDIHPVAFRRLRLAQQQFFRSHRKGGGQTAAFTTTRTSQPGEDGHTQDKRCVDLRR